MESTAPRHLAEPGEGPASPGTVDAALAAVTALLPGGGEARAGQVAMAEAVATAIEGGRHLIVSAGTGTGKSLGYLVPAALSGKRVIVATATKALQDQLAENDLPLVARALGGRVRFAVLKGRSNYLCRQRADEIGLGGAQPEIGDAPADGDAEQGPGRDTDPVRLADQVRRLLAWSEETNTGDRAELSFEPSPRAWAMLSVGPRECPGAFRCPKGPVCFAEAARAAAAEAEIVVVNTHLYGAHLASGGAVLPPHDIVVFDEAHELEDVMTQSLGVEVTPGRLRALGNLAREVAKGDDAPKAMAGLVEGAERLHAALAGRTGTRVFAGTDVPADRELAATLEAAGALVERVIAAVRRGEAPSLLDTGPDDTGRRARALSAAGHLSSDLARFAGRGGDDVAWVDGMPRAPVLRLSPIDVGPPLAEQLWGEVGAVLTSATIPVRSAQRLGIDAASVDELDVGSPFDYRNHALLYVARHLPDRRSPESEPAIHEELAALIRAAGGRTLALFTSRRATDAAAVAVAELVNETILVQGQYPKARLLAEFARDESTCLFATLGFWQGVDIPGRSLSLVALDRLPFARPDDPLFEARRERAGERAFSLVDLPRAATLLAQGAGRLIRSATDRGVVAVLDPRLATAGYRAVLLAAMPPMRRTTDRRQVEDFLARILDDEAAQ
jgi:ATP-dependent DNA helicase DinG